MVETAVVERGEKIVLPEKFLETIGIKHNEKVVIEFNDKGLFISPLRKIGSITKEIDNMNLPVCDWEDMEKEIEEDRQIIVEKKNEPIDVEQLTLDYLVGKIKQKGSIDEIKINSRELQQAIYNTFGTNDPIELIDMVRR